MPQSQLIDQLRGYAGRMQKVRLSRRTPCAPTLNGFILTMSDTWLLLWQFHDFYPDGFTMIRLDGITDYRSGKYEDFWTDMLRKEKIVDQLPDPKIDLSSERTMLASLQETQKNFIVESEDPEEDIEDFYLGRAVRILNTCIEFASFDGLGKWDDNLHTIAYDEVTRIQFDTPYANSFSRYTDGDCPFPIRVAE